MKEKTLTLTETQVDQIRESIDGLMYHYHLSDRYADYCCEFCGKTAQTNNTFFINHESDCSGQAILNMLELPQAQEEEVINHLLHNYD